MDAPRIQDSVIPAGDSRERRCDETVRVSVRAVPQRGPSSTKKVPLQAVEESLSNPLTDSSSLGAPF